MARVRYGAVLLVILAAGCSKGGSDVAAAGPTGLTVEPGMSFDEVVLRWTPPAGPLDGYVIEGRIGGGPFEEVAREAAPPGTMGAYITIDPAVPELVTIGFRVRSYLGGRDSAPSNEATHARGVRAPQMAAPIEVAMGPDGTASGPVRLRWTTTSLVANVLQVERAVVDPSGSPGPFTPLPVAFPAQALEDADLTPGSAYAYRVRHGRDGTFSAWAEARTSVIDWPIHAAGDLAAAPALQGSTRVDPITVTWTNASTLADTLELSRAEVLEGGELGPWTALSAAFPATSYVDQDVVDPKAYAYRVRYSLGAQESAIAEVRSEPVDLLAPRDLTVTRTEAGYQLAWVNRSLTATEVRVDRTTIGMDLWPPPGAPVLPATATGYADARGVAWPGTRYTVAAARWPYLAAVGPIEIPAPVVTGPIGLRGAVTTLPSGLSAARDSSLRFHVYSGAVYRPTGDGWERYELPWPYSAATTGIQLDGDDHPHTLYKTMTETIDGRTWTLTHLWHDGTAWQTEEAASVLQTVANQYSIEWELLGVDAAGVAQIFYDRAGGTTYDLVHAVRGATSWASTPFAPTTVADPFTLRVAGDVAPDGTACFAILLIDRPPAPAPNVDRVVLFTRATDGTWTEEIAPTGEASTAGGLAMIAVDGGTVGLVYPRSGEYWFVGKVGGTWGTPERVIPLVLGGDERMALGARASDGRIHLVVQGTEPAPFANLCAREAGAWTCAPFAPWPQYGALSTGHRPDGKAWVLAFPVSNSGLASAALYEEP